MKALKFFLWILLYALASLLNFFVFALIFALTLEEAPTWLAALTTIISVLAFVFLTIRKYRMTFPKEAKPQMSAAPQSKAAIPEAAKKYCQHCGAHIDRECVVCPVCGKQVAKLKAEYHDPHSQKRPINKGVAFALCLFFGAWGIHRFYEGRILSGIIYLCTSGFLGIGVIIDLIAILCKHNPYYI